jgi:hypothetical protein
MEQELKQFLESLASNENAPVMETVMKGYKCIFEGYADVVDEVSFDATTRFNQMAAYNSSLDGNNILSFLQRSSEQLNPRYSVDEEPELDNFGTSDIMGNPYQSTQIDLDSQVDVGHMTMDSRSFENNLGLTAQDMKDLF